MCMHVSALCPLHTATHVFVCVYNVPVRRALLRVVRWLMRLTAPKAELKWGGDQVQTSNAFGRHGGIATPAA